MNLVQIHHDGRPVTTSLAIAEGVGNPHASVIRLIRDNIPELEDFGLVGFEIEPRSVGQHGGGDTEYAVLNEPQATLLLTYMRNNEVVKAFKKALVRAFFAMRDELSRRSVPELSRMEILRLAMESEQERIRLERRVVADRPLVEFAQRVEAAPDAVSVGEAAKLIGTGRRRMFAFLREIGWVTRRNEPYQAKIELGYLDVKLGNWEHPDHGLKQSVTTIVTGRGLVRLRQLWTQRHPEATTDLLSSLDTDADSGLSTRKNG